MYLNLRVTHNRVTGKWSTLVFDSSYSIGYGGVGDGYWGSACPSPTNRCYDLLADGVVVCSSDGVISGSFELSGMANTHACLTGIPKDCSACTALVTLG